MIQYKKTKQMSQNKKCVKKGGENSEKQKLVSVCRRSGISEGQRKNKCKRDSAASVSSFREKKSIWEKNLTLL